MVSLSTTLLMKGDSSHFVVVSLDDPQHTAIAVDSWLHCRNTQGRRVVVVLVLGPTNRWSLQSQVRVLLETKDKVYPERVQGEKGHRL